MLCMDVFSSMKKKTAKGNNNLTDLMQSSSDTTLSKVITKISVRRKTAPNLQIV